MRSGKKWMVALVFSLAVFTSASYAADRYVRLQSVEGEVSIYSRDGQRPSEATVNSPLMDGDEIQTGQGRAELSFNNGITVRIGDNSGVRLQSTYTPMSIVLLLGTIFVDSHLVDRFKDDLVVRAAEAEVYLIDEGNIRVDLGNEGSVRVTTIQGQAEVQSAGRRVLVRSGERTYIDPGREPNNPEAFAGREDELDEWNENRMDYYARSDSYDDYVDDDIRYDTYDLEGYGDWRYSGSYGHVWVPHVEYGWRPYYDGRWSYLNNSWFWVSNEPWGWAPYHYGRWGWSFAFGWYWIPGNVFGPSWVSWYSYGDYVGWCPLNYYNYPVYYNNGYGYGYPSIQKPRTLDVTNSWTFVKKNDLGVTNIKKAVLDSPQVKNIRIEKDKVFATPKRELVSYVIPKTTQTPGYVNNKTIIKGSSDIKNPVGVKNHEEQFERPGKIVKGNSDHSVKGKNSDKSADKPAKDPIKIQPGKQVPKVKEEKSQQKNNDRDFQFKRNESTRPRYSPYSNPYYKGRSTSDQDQNGSKSKPWSGPSSDEHSFDRPKDVNPKYRDEARKYFERFEHKNRGDLEQYDSPSRSNNPPVRTYESPKKSYEAPKRDYRAPESKRPDYSGRSNQNNNRSKSSGSSKSNNSSNNRKSNQ